MAKEEEEVTMEPVEMTSISSIWVSPMRMMEPFPKVFSSFSSVELSTFSFSAFTLFLISSFSILDRFNDFRGQRYAFFQSFKGQNQKNISLETNLLR